MLKNLNLLAAVGIIISGSVPVAAQNIPQDLLAVDKQRIMKDCVPAFGEAVCEALSDCTVKEFEKRLDMETYLNLTMQLSRNEVDANNRQLLDTIARYCTAELERTGIISNNAS
ncbi:hypothetical protein GCM10017044_27440 [Kordiimonas sediminis]|uniref:UrcA family protein n=1 Tax=Kordiimonas sediminis TaxID=1735581 RepID=A0A919E978_9PROT|nr:hypothetical protein [Kordiimonas sediminis]GHF30574.1 hypothetical protein GCM10017044_27440 [Kordiimonas sediminis]